MALAKELNPIFAPLRGAVRQGADLAWNIHASAFLRILGCVYRAKNRIQERLLSQILPQRHHPHTASPLNLLPPPLIHPQPLRHQLTGNTSPLQLAPASMQLPPAGRHLDQEAPIAQEVVHLAVGVAAGKGPEVAPLGHVAAGGQDDPHHGDLLQVFPGMAGAAREVGRHRSGDVPMLERQGIGRGVGMVAAVGPAAAPSSWSAMAPGSCGVLVIGARPMARGRGNWGAGVGHGSAFFFGDGVLAQGGVRLVGRSAEGWAGSSGSHAAPREGSPGAALVWPAGDKRAPVITLA